MKIKKFVSIMLVSVILMCSAAVAVSAIESHPYCPKCGGTLLKMIIRDNPDCYIAAIYVEDCTSCDYITNTNIPGSHKDENGDNKCDKCRAKLEEEKSPETETTTPDVTDKSDNTEDSSENTVNCSCNCHKGGVSGLLWKISNFIAKLFKIKSKQICTCGVTHF